MEFTIENEKLFMLQTRNGKRTASAALKIACDMVAEGLLTKEEGRLYSRLLQNRITGDYNDFFDFASEDVLPLLEPTRQLLLTLDRLINQL